MNPGRNLGYVKSQKDKFYPRTTHKDPEGKQRCTSTLSLTSVLDEIDWSTPCLAALALGKTQYPLYRRLGGLQGWSGGENLTPHRDSIPGPSSPDESLYRLG